MSKMEYDSSLVRVKLGRLHERLIEKSIVHVRASLTITPSFPIAIVLDPKVEKVEPKSVVNLP